MSYETVIGLEIHAQLKTRTKMFCDSLNDPDEERPNINVCPVCLGHPGTLPVANKEAIYKTIKAGIALGCSIRQYTWFERKNYFYPDLPKGYQISQYEAPFCEKGELTLASGKKIRITRVHLEEDTGRIQHSSKTDESLIDYNRAGTPLMELVTEPDLSSAEETVEFGRELQQLLRYLDVSDADMEKGQMRLEANLSLRPKGEKELGAKVELKNINSFRAMSSAIAYEVARQEKLLTKGEAVGQETRGWDSEKQQTFSQRTKEESHDYRYFPEPDLPPVELSDEEIANIRAEVVELPQERRARLEKEYGLKPDDARIFTLNKELGDYFEQVVSELKQWAKDEGITDKKDELITLAANYLISELQTLLDEHETTVEELKMRPENVAELIIMVHEGTVSSSGAQKILSEMVSRGDVDPSHLLDELGLKQVSDEGALEGVAREVIDANPDAVADYKNGKESAIKFLVGQMMAKTKGAANPQVAQEILKKILDA